VIGEIEKWIEYVMVPREELFGMAICPYAKRAVTNKSYIILSGTTNDIHGHLKSVDLKQHEVTIIIVEDYLNFSVKDLQEITKYLNMDYRDKDLVILENDPRDPNIVNGITTTFEGGFLLLVQSLSDLNEKSSHLSKSNYYSLWSKEQMDKIVNWRVR
jgi:hypothetical protein